MHFWLFKTDPDAFSIDDLETRPSRTEPWDGVRNYQARNLMRDEMKRGDRGFLYHSNCAEPGIVGVVEVVGEGRPDPTAFDPSEPHYDAKSDPDSPRWYLVDVKLVHRFACTLTLAELKAHPELEDMTLLKRGNRLSVMPVEPSHWAVVVDLAS